MTKQANDRDYLVVSARIRALENQLFTGENLTRLLNAPDLKETQRILTDAGYPELDPEHPESLDQAIGTLRGQVLEDLCSSKEAAPFADLFRAKFDYHNIKSLVKSRALGVEPERLLSPYGRVEPAELASALERSDFKALPPTLAAAAEDCANVLDTTRDPQLSDSCADRWYFADLTAAARATGSVFAERYAASLIDRANLPALVRSLRMHRPAEALKSVLVEGGSVGSDDLVRIAAAGGAGLAERFAHSDFEEAAVFGAAAIAGGALTDFERALDDAVSTSLSGAATRPFGPEVLLAYLHARETEYTNLRIVLLGKKLGLDPEVIRSRLRASSV